MTLSCIIINCLTQWQSFKKRFTLTGSGKIKRKHAYHSHILTKKTKKQKRNLDHFAVLEKVDVARVKELLVL